MRVIIAGSRDITAMSEVEAAIAESGFEITEVVSGGARGVDLNGMAWARKNGMEPIIFLPEWDKYPGKSAGFVRNIQMAECAAEVNGGLIAVYDGVSAGTKHMIKEAKKRNLKIYIHEVKPE